MQVKDIYSGVKARVPHLCDDTVSPCPYCKQKHPLWQHQAAWGLQSLKQKNLAHSTQRGFWVVTTERQAEPETATVGREESLHDRLKREIKEIGEILGKYAKEEYTATPYSYDVVWKEIEGLPRPSHVFEVQDKGAVDGALAKLQHARDIWRPKLFLIVTGERDRRKVDMLLEPFLKGTFHGIRRDTTVLTAEIIKEIHQALSTHRELVRQFLEI
jgi:hypothetical protein